MFNIRNEIFKLKLKHSNKIRLKSIGRTLLGEDIFALVIGEGNKHLLLQGGIHAREYITCELLIALADDCAENIEKLNGVCVHILPAVNPDGIKICLGQNQTYAKYIYENDIAEKREKSSFDEYIKRFKANALGVDLNRNFPAGWEEMDTGIHSLSAFGYKGKAPASEKETLALMVYTKMYNFAATVSYHASGREIYAEYGSDDEINAKSLKLAQITKRITGYEIKRQDANSAGGYKDWAMSALKIPSITIEVGRGECPILKSEFDEIYKENRELIFALAKELT